MASDCVNCCIVWPFLVIISLFQALILVVPVMLWYLVNTVLVVGTVGFYDVGILIKATIVTGIIGPFLKIASLLMYLFIIPVYALCTIIGSLFWGAAVAIGYPFYLTFSTFADEDNSCIQAIAVYSIWPKCWENITTIWSFHLKKLPEIFNDYAEKSEPGFDINPFRLFIIFFIWLYSFVVTTVAFTVLVLLKAGPFTFRLWYHIVESFIKIAHKSGPGACAIAICWGVGLIVAPIVTVGFIIISILAGMVCSFYAIPIAFGDILKGLESPFWVIRGFDQMTNEFIFHKGTSCIPCEPV